MSQQENSRPSRTITLEEHYAIPSFLEEPGQHRKDQVQAHPHRVAGQKELMDRLSDLNDRRIAEMDAASIDMQVLSLSAPGTEQLDAHDALALARDANDLLAIAVRHHSNRFAGFAALPSGVPDAAAEELERTIHTYGFKGALINGHIRGRYLDDPFFWPILERAEALQVPLYLHPTPPPQEVIATSYTGNFTPEVTIALSTVAWGWHIETATHVLRIILGGAFDRYPRLQLIIGHMGEALPFMLPRIDDKLPVQLTKLDRPLGPICARTSTIRAVASTTFQISWICCFKWESTGSCSPPTIPIVRWSKHTPFWNSCQSALPIRNRSYMATRSASCIWEYKSQYSRPKKFLNRQHELVGRAIFDCVVITAPDRLARTQVHQTLLIEN